jgi:hypothetical protein
VIGFPCFLVIALPLGLLIGALILRGAVSMANRGAGSRPEPIEYEPVDEDDWSDYPVPGRTREEPSEGIPVPGIAKGMGIMFSILIVNAIIGLVVRFLIVDDQAFVNRRGRGFFDDPEVRSRVVTLPIALIVMIVLLGAMLPARFTRAGLVTFYYFLICIGVVLVIGVPLFAIGVALGIR